MCMLCLCCSGAGGGETERRDEATQPGAGGTEREDEHLRSMYFPLLCYIKLYCRLYSLIPKPAVEWVQD